MPLYQVYLGQNDLNNRSNSQGVIVQKGTKRLPYIVHCARAFDLICDPSAIKEEDNSVRFVNLDKICDQICLTTRLSIHLTSSIR